MYDQITQSGERYSSGAVWDVGASQACAPTAPVVAVPQERDWRCFPDDQEVGTHREAVLVSTWHDKSAGLRRLESTSPNERYVISIALRATRVRITRGGTTVFDGVMAPGTVLISKPGEQMACEFRDPCEFVNLYASADYIEGMARRLLLSEALKSNERENLLFRDRSLEQLGRTLADACRSREDIRAVSHTIALKVLDALTPKTKQPPLQKWRLKLVQDYVAQNAGEQITLALMAAVSGLSKMHFAAQFRVATGFRPHEYLVFRRIEDAKRVLATTDTPLAEVALTVGFQGQSHFSTVFKRHTGETPGRWRSAMLASSKMSKSLPGQPGDPSRDLVRRDYSARSDGWSGARLHSGSGRGAQA